MRMPYNDFPFLMIDKTHFHNNIYIKFDLCRKAEVFESLLSYFISWTDQYEKFNS